MTNSTPLGRSCWLASRMPRGWAMPPMNPWPIVRILICFMSYSSRLLLLALLRLRLGLRLGLRRLLGGSLLLGRRLLRDGLRSGLRGLLGRAVAVGQGVQPVGALLARR